MGNVPLALIGSVAALWLAGQPLSVASMIGFITLTGIAVRNGILKISHYINLALKEGMPFGHDLVVRGSVERLTPVLMTAMSAGVALVPLLIDAANPGKEILHPVAVTIFGGLLSATLLDTLLTPVLFLRYGKAPSGAAAARRRRDARRRPRPIQPPKLFDINTRRMTMNAKFLMVAALLCLVRLRLGARRQGNEWREGRGCRLVSRRTGFEIRQARTFRQRREPEVDPGNRIQGDCDPRCRRQIPADPAGACRQRAAFRHRQRRIAGSAKRCRPTDRAGWKDGAGKIRLSGLRSKIRIDQPRSPRPARGDSCRCGILRIGRSGTASNPYRTMSILFDAFS